MDINIVTFHTALNAGAVLQAQALQDFIETIGLSAGVYDYRPPIVVGGTGFKGIINKSIRLLNKRGFETSIYRFRDYEMKSLHLNHNLEVPIFISGSDQVWNATGNMNPMFFLRFLDKSIYKASYAASMGKTTVPEEKKTVFASYINEFDSISVRENDAKDLLSRFTEKDIAVHIDPTLLMDKEYWLKHEKEVKDIPKRYILAYILHPPKNVNLLLKWLKEETDLPVVLIDGDGRLSFIVKHDKVIYSAGPAQFLWLFSHAECIVTSSFHGTAFAINMQKEFYSIINPNAPSRLKCLLDLFELSGIDENSKSFKRNNNIDWEKIRLVRDSEFNKSKEYILNIKKASVKKRTKHLQGTIEDVERKCVGCMACQAVCPVNAIDCMLNAEGFYEPLINHDICIKCSKCINTCPLEKKNQLNRKRAYYGWHNDKGVLQNSSSGGAFYALAQNVLKDGGIVYGAKYSDDYKKVVFSNTDVDGLDSLLKSKYTVSDINGIYRSIQKNLESGRFVMLCCTPCQAAGLKSFLSKDYSNLLLVDFICGGMSSLIFYQEHLSFLEKKFGSKIINIDFRPKDKGWGKQRIKVVFQNGKTYFVRSYLDSYFKCFASEHISVRESCLQCEFSYLHSSDITIADFWGYKNIDKLKKGKGINLIVANSTKGIKAIERMQNFQLFEMPLSLSDYAFRVRNIDQHQKDLREIFFKEALQNGFEKASNKICPATQKEYIKKHMKRIMLRK